MDELEQAKAKATAAYNAAADYFDHPVGSFWRRFGRRTVERLGLGPGETVLDVCCGSGGSALLSQPEPRHHLQQPDAGDAEAAVVWLQIRMARIAERCLEKGAPPPPIYKTYFRWWFALGWPAFIAMIVIFWLMVAKPQF